mmetsp:Transcript_2786/g.6212  ORF Transcript_2786/g.6212 Transcript_2786/m.6212 type:complete len:205 (+) Transcript_2786:291-905(+)
MRTAAPPGRSNFPSSRPLDVSSPPAVREAKHRAPVTPATKLASQPVAAVLPATRLAPPWLSSPLSVPASVAQRRSTAMRTRLPRASLPADSHRRLSLVRHRASCAPPRPSALGGGAAVSKYVRKYQSSPPSPGGSSIVNTPSSASPQHRASSAAAGMCDIETSADRLSQAQPSAGRNRRKRRCRAPPPSTVSVARSSKPAGCMP